LSQGPVLRFGHSSTSVSSTLCPPALCHFPRLRQPPTTHPATPDHCPLALQPTCLDSSSSMRSGGRARLELGSSRHMEMAVERTRAVCPPHTHGTHKRRQAALSLHAQGRGLGSAPRALGTGEATSTEATSRAWRGWAWGAAEGFQRCSSNYGIHDCKALSNRSLVSEQVAAGREVFQ